MLKTFAFFQGGEGVIPAPVAINVSFDGDLFIDETLTGEYTYVSPQPEMGSTYQWYRANDAMGGGAVAIGGATAETYDVVLADVQKYLAFQVTPSDGVRIGAPARSPYLEIGVLAPTASAVNIDGTLLYDELLTGDYTYSDPQGYAESGSTFQWFRANDGSGTGSAPIGGATNDIYTTVAADLTKFLRFQVTPSNGIESGTPAVSSWDEIIVLPPTATDVEYTGDLELAGLLTGTYTYNDPQGLPAAGPAYRWFRANDAGGGGAAPIGGAVASTYTIVLADLEKFIAFAVTPSNGYEDGTEVLSTYQEVVVAAPTATSVGISGVIENGTLVTGTYTYNDPQGLPESGSTYEWWIANSSGGAGAAQIPGATLVTYTPTTGDLFKFLQFRVTPNNGYVTGTQGVSTYQVVGPAEVIALAHSTTPFITTYQFDNVTGFGGKYANPAALPPGNANGCKFNTANSALAVGTNTSVQIEVYHWGNGTGYGSKYTAPAVGPAGSVSAVAFRPQDDAIVIAGLASPYLEGWPWDNTTGFGTKYSNPGALPAGQGNGLAFTPNGNSIAVAHVTTPFVSAYPFSASTGFGTKKSNPGVLPAGDCRDVAFNSDGDVIFLAHATSPFISAYAWDDSAGFGTKFSNPSVLPVDQGTGIAVNPPRTAVAFTTVTTPYVEVYHWDDATGFGAKYSAPATPPALNGQSVTFNPANNAIAVAHAITPFITAYPWTDAGGFGTKYSNPSILATGNATYAAFSH